MWCSRGSIDGAGKAVLHVGMRQGLTFAFALLLVASPAAAGTIEDIQGRGVVTCAVPAQSPGISEKAASGRSGLAVDLCSLLAAAVLGRAEALAFVEVSAEDGAVALQAGEADVLFSPQPWRMSQEVEDGVMLVQPLLVRASDAAVFGPVVRQGDDAWFVSLRWLLLALKAEPAAVTPDAAARIASGLGLHPRWIENIGSVSKDYAAFLERHMKVLESQGWVAFEGSGAATW